MGVPEIGTKKWNSQPRRAMVMATKRAIARKRAMESKDNNKSMATETTTMTTTPTKTKNTTRTMTMVMMTTKNPTTMTKTTRVRWLEAAGEGKEGSSSGG